MGIYLHMDKYIWNLEWIRIIDLEKYTWIFRYE